MAPLPHKKKLPLAGQWHERALAHGDERCRLDCSARLQLQARLQPRLRCQGAATLLNFIAPPLQL